MWFWVIGRRFKKKVRISSITKTIIKLDSGVSKNILYELADISRQGYHQALLRNLSKGTIENQVLKKVINHRKNDLYTGSRILYHLLKINEMGINKFERLVSLHGLSGKVKKNKIKTTDGKRYKEDKNLINGFVLSDINQVIAGDITYFQSGKQLYYIFSLKDAYSKRILGLGGYLQMTAVNALKVLNQAIEERGIENLHNTIHHTDAGSQYRSNIYRERLSECKMQISIAGNALENGMAEQFNFIVKTHHLEKYKINSEKHLNKILQQIKYEINYIKPKKSLKYRTPNAFEDWIKTIDKDKRPTQKLHDFEVDK